MTFGQKMKEKSKFRKLKKSADNGDSESQYQVAMYYIDGIIVKQDLLRARNYLTQSANSGYIPAKVYLKTKGFLDAVSGVVKIVDSISQNTNYKY